MIHSLSTLAFGIFLTLLIYSISGCAEASVQMPDEPIVEQATGYEAVLAKKLGADAYGMQTYIVAFLKRGANRSQDSTEAAQLQRAHLDNIQKLARDGKLLIAGPFMDDQEIRGIYIFDVRTIEEAEALTATDPAIKAGRLLMELHPWYGPAALPLLNDMHERVRKKKI
jgi:uncharacterized protein YciI